MTIPTINLNVRMKGHYQLEAINSETGVKRNVAEFDNLIVNQGLDMLGQPPAYNAGIAACCIVGTGTTPESATDTTIQTFLAGTKTQTGSVAYASQLSTTPYYTTTAVTWQFPTGAAAGNLTEIVIGFISSTGTNVNPNAATPAFSRTLIRSGGVPVTITILSNEILNVIYTVQIFVPNVDFTGTFSLNINGTPTTFNYDIKPVGLNNLGIAGMWAFGANGTGFQFQAPNAVGGNDSFYGYQQSTWAFSAITTTPSGLSGSSFGGSTASYVTGSYSNNFTYTLPPATANYASGIGGLVIFSTPTIWQIGITPAIMKTNLETLTIVFAISWSN